ncbi:hypothetical protein IMZ11_34030 [Microtetraspora sp. AC03309]|uniref:hypothetical protein n=1 Tax=Microtetraspora sp. AC03309 TaxID=2779376 RepID=UPI001E3D40CF|nr:hypothetical protein [Microtetraspora sp. AC03309]MCC5580649.1 hypothetical protein [Microtetraspora sp. AC03309]
MTENQNPLPGDARGPSSPYDQATPYGQPTQYGQGSPYAQGTPYPQGAYGTPPPQGPVRPRILWIILAWLLFVILLVVGVAGFAGGLTSTIKDAASITTFKSGEKVNVRLDPKDKPAIYASSDHAANVTCKVEDDAGLDVSLTQPTASQTITYGDAAWGMVFQIGAPTAGAYNVSCEGEGEDVWFGVGNEIMSSMGKLVGGMVAMIALPSVGFLIAVIVTIVVLVRRSGARKRAMR